VVAMTKAKSDAEACVNQSSEPRIRTLMAEIQQHSSLL
jgi:hypothetical protein